MREYEQWTKEYQEQVENFPVFASSHGFDDTGMTIEAEREEMKQIKRKHKGGSRKGKEI